MRRAVGLMLAAALLLPSSAAAHATLVRTDPAESARLGASPTVVRLSFNERPDAALSRVRVLDAADRVRQSGPATPVAGDPHTLGVPVPPLPRGSYTVVYRAVAADDGHATEGSFTFGVRAAPGAAAPVPVRPGSALELPARVLFLAGLIVLLGAVAARLGGFGGAADLRLAALGWVLAVGGLVLLAEAQRRNAQTGLGVLLDSSAGHGLLARAAAVLSAGVALLFSRHLPRGAPALAGLSALGAMEAHVAAGHAATSATRVAFQVVHLGAAGLWAGGLAALLAGVRGAPSTAKAAAAARFSRLAVAAFALLVVTGAARAVEQLPSAGDLLTTGYGRALAVKALLVVPIVGLGARQRLHTVPVAVRDLRPLRRTGRTELGIAAGALLAAGMLGTLAPPVVSGAAGPRGLVATGGAPGIGVRLTTASRQPGPNRFVLQASRPVADARLRFTPLDDPGVRPTTLPLAAGSRETFSASGANLSFDGRWRVEALLGPVVVPLELDVDGPEQFLTVLRTPGRAPQLTRLVPRLGYVRVSPRGGRLFVSAFDLFESEARIRYAVLTQTRDGVTRRRPLRRLGPGRFVAETVAGGRLAVVAYRSDGARMRSVFEDVAR